MINKLTKEQEALIPVIREKWIKIGLSTDTNVPLAEEGIREAYEIAGVKAPKEIIWFDSPTKIKKLGKDIIYGQHEAGWLSFYDFFLQCGIKECAKLNGLMKIAQSACWWVPLKDKVYICEKAYVTKMDDRSGPMGLCRLHCTNGPAFAWRGGPEMYFWHGVRIPKSFITNPDKVDILAIPNQEQKRVLCELLGWEKVLSKLGAKEIQKDDFGSIFKLDSLNDLQNNKAHLVRFKCPSTDRIYIQLTSSNYKTAHEAIAATFQLTPDTYNPEQES